MSEETISLAEAVTIWLETGEWPKVAEPIMNACLPENIRRFLSFDDNQAFHKNQRFVKPVERKTALATLEEKLKEGYLGVAWDVSRMLARRIDELEAKVR